MECPRCGGDVTVYRLGSHETVACDSCEYADITVEHGSEPTVSESWTTALARFHETTGAAEGEGERDGDADGDTEEGGGSEEGGDAEEDGDAEQDGETEQDGDAEQDGEPGESGDDHGRADTDARDGADDAADAEAGEDVPSVGSAVEGIDVPGEGVERARRRAAIRGLYDRLRQAERATSEELVALVDADAVDYESAEAFWTGVGRDRLATLPGVLAPEEDGSEWRFSAAAAEGAF